MSQKYHFAQDKLRELLKEENVMEAEIVRAGKWDGYEIQTDKGIETVSVEISEEMLSEMEGNFMNPEVTNHNRVDVHISHPGNPDYVPGAVGWITSVKRIGKSLYASIAFLESFANEIRSGKWGGFSIEAKGNAKHPGTGESIGAYLTGLGVTNKPFIRGMEFPGLSDESKSVSENECGIYLSMIEMGETSMEEMKREDEMKKGEPMKEEEKKMEDAVAPSLGDALRSILQSEMSDEELAQALASVDAEALRALMAPAKEEAAEGAPSSEEGANAAPVASQKEILASQIASMNFEAQVSSLNLALSEMNSKLAEANAKLAKYQDIEFSQMIEAGIKEGKAVLAAQKEHLAKLFKIDRSLAESFIASAPKTVAMSQLLTPVLAETVSVDEEQKRIDAMAREMIEKARAKK